MLSLKSLVMRSLKNDVTEFSDTVLRHFPDPNDRTPNDPLYFVSSDAVVKFANYLAQKHDVESVVSASGLTSTHLLLLRNYALFVGWSDVYVSGRQLVLEAKFPFGNIHLVDTLTAHTGTNRLTVDLNGVTELKLLSNLAEVAPHMHDLQAQTFVTGMTYAYNGMWLFGEREPIPMLSNDNGELSVKVPSSGMELTYSTINHVLYVKRDPSKESSNAPDLHCFDVSWSVLVPTDLT